MEENFKVFDKKDYPKDLSILPLRDIVIYPGMIMPLSIGRELSIKIVNESFEDTKFIALIPQKNPEQEDITPDDLKSYGCIAYIHRILKTPDNSVKAVIQGIDVIKIKKYIKQEPYLRAKFSLINYKHDKKDLETQSLMRTLLNSFEKAISLSNYLPQELLFAAMNVDDPIKLAFLISANIQFKTFEQQEILEIENTNKQLKRVLELLEKEIYLLELGKKIQSEVQSTIGKTQKEFFLREQISAIRKELGEDDEKTSDIKEIKKKIEELKIPEDIKKDINKELSRLDKIPVVSPEYVNSRNYLEWVSKLPWNKSSKERLDIKKAKEILDKHHYGQDKLKDRILEYLSIYKRKQKSKNKDLSMIKNPIICFVGPPGVGKTSFAKSIAESLNRKEIRISLGGVRDESEIRGHRRTYVSSLPGKIMQSLAKVGVDNPVFILDEIDKMGMSYNGDPASALLEVLDPAQNKDFRDHYLDIPFDLSKIMFITTANVLDTIPYALRDRMEIIEIGSYTLEEKKEIAKSHLIEKQLKENYVSKEQISFNDESLERIISNYTREAGVRSLERTINKVIRKAITKMELNSLKSIIVNESNLEEFLKRPKYLPEKEIEERMGVSGVAIGLSWTQVGGDILFIEATKVKGKKNLKLTGQLGDVMKESAQTALSYVYSHQEKIGFDSNIIENTEIHLHVPDGAIPKDGPSAGITMATAITSLLTNKKVKQNLGMTGEITLTGKVLPIGGVKEKILAAYRLGVNEIILPKRNKLDLEEDVPSNVREKMKFHFVSNIDEVFNVAFE